MMWKTKISKPTSAINSETPLRLCLFVCWCVGYKFSNERVCVKLSHGIMNYWLHMYNLLLITMNEWVNALQWNELNYCKFRYVYMYMRKKTVNECMHAWMNKWLNDWMIEWSWSMISPSCSSVCRLVDFDWISIQL